jgi:S1-C subfamily serine protease
VAAIAAVAVYQGVLHPRTPAGAASRTARPRPPDPGTNLTGRGELLPEERTTIGIYRRVSPSVVSVANQALVRGGFFGFQIYEVPRGAGSGFVWDREGHIISNFHVVHEANSVTVTFPDGKTYDARIVGTAPDYDLAVLQVRVPAEKLRPVSVGASRDLLVGQTVLAIGNPFGLDTSLSVGVISALGRTITAMTEQKIHDLIQTDAAINPGNSGGPLLDSSGRLIGINTAILSPSGAYAGIGFAVPVDTISRIVPQLIDKGYVSRAGLGIQLLNDHVAQQVGIQGVAVYAVPPESDAARAGIDGLSRSVTGDLVLGDVIVGIDGKPVAGLDDLRSLLENGKPGDRVQVQLARGDKRRTVTVKLTEEQ